MNHKIFFYIFFSLLSISYQLNCEDFNDSTCGGHNTKYNIKCLKFTESPTCSEVEFDDGCIMTEQKKCQKTDTSSTNYQCYLSESSTPSKIKCERVNLDEYCEINESTKECKQRNGVSIELNHKCKMVNQGKECKLQPFECNDYGTNNCNKYGDNCFIVDNNYQLQCQIVTVDNKCTINSDGHCVGKAIEGPDFYEKCEYNSLFTECKARNKYCAEMDSDKCALCQSSESGYICAKIDGSCKNIQVDSSCMISDSGTCEKSNVNDNNICQFDYSKTICKFYEVNSECRLTTFSTSITCGNGDHLDANKKCEFKEVSGTKATCESRAKICSDYDYSSCEGIKSETKKCSWTYFYYYCEEYAIDIYCTVNGGVCGRASGVPNEQFGENQECLFDYLRKTCTKKEKKCENYFSDCGSHSSGNTQCVKFSNNNYCQSIAIDANCEVKSNGECKAKTIIDNNKICSFNEGSEKTSCKIKDKVCKDYYFDSIGCNSAPNCVFYNYNCYQYENDNDCIVQNGQCNTKDGGNVNEYEKCFFSYKDSDTLICGKTNKDCSEYNSNSTKCNNAPKINEKQCYFKYSTCKNLYLDGNCIMNYGDQCVENGSGKLSSNEICYSIEDTFQIYCGKREKLCSDYDTDTCGYYSPEMKLCFKLDSGACREVKVDDQCSINEKNECNGNHCHFDEDKKRCYFEDNNGSVLKINRIILLILLFIF